MSIPTDPTSKISRLVGDYVLIRELGRGAFGTAYETRHRSTGMRWVVKEVPLSPTDAEHPQLEALYPARSAEISNHVIGTHSYFFEDHEGRRVLYVVSEFIEHGSLRDFLDQHQPLPVEEALEIALGVGRGLVAVHDRGVVHLDLKPGNVLMDRKDGRWVPKIADFGQARAAGSPVPASFASPGYAAPEQLAGKVVPAHSADLFPFGMILAELLLGRPVAPRGDMASYRVWLTTDMRVEAIAGTCATLSRRREVEDLVAWLLQHDPAGRPTAAMAVDGITAVLHAIRTARVGATMPLPRVDDQRPEVTVAVERESRPQLARPGKRRLAWLLPMLGAALIAAWTIGRAADHEGPANDKPPDARPNPDPQLSEPLAPRPNRGGGSASVREAPRSSSNVRSPSAQRLDDQPSAAAPSAAAAPSVQPTDTVRSAGGVPTSVVPETMSSERAPAVSPVRPLSSPTSGGLLPAPETVARPPMIRVVFRRACETANPVQGNLDGVVLNVERGLRGRGVTLDAPRVVVVAAGSNDSAITGVELRGQFRVCGDGDGACLALAPNCTDACSFDRRELRDQNRAEALTQLADAIAGATAASVQEAVSVCSRWP